MSESAFLSNRAIESKCFIRAQGMTIGAGTQVIGLFTVFWKKGPYQHSIDLGQNISLMEFQHAYVGPACMWKLQMYFKSLIEEGLETFETFMETFSSNSFEI